MTAAPVSEARWRAHLDAFTARGARPRALLAGFAALMLVVAGISVYRWRVGRPLSRVRYETAPIERGPITARVTATGTLSALVTVQVGTQVSGRIKTIDVDYNSHVTKGQVIATLEPELFEAALEQARANYVAAQGTVAKLQALAWNGRQQYDRARALLQRKAIAQADLDSARTAARAAAADVAAAFGNREQAKAALHLAQVNREYTTIVSPTTGVVISRSVDVGQTVAASLQSPTLFVIAEDLAKMQVDTSVAEADIGKLSPGIEATFTVDAFPTRVFRGKVRQIRNAAQTVQNVVTYDAVVDVDNSNMALRPGMTATVTFAYDHRDETLRVANAALRFQPPPAFVSLLRSGGHGARAATLPSPAMGRSGAAAQAEGDPSGALRRTLWIRRERGAVPVPVRIGLTDGTATGIVAGDVHEGDLAVVDISGLDEDAESPGSGGGLRRLF